MKSSRVCSWIHVTQSTWDQKSYAIRDSDSTTHTGAIETAEDFEERLYYEAWNRGWSRGKKESRYGRSSRIELRADCRSLSSASAPVGSGTQVVSQRFRESESLDQGSPEALLDNGKIEKQVIALRFIQSTHIDV